MIQFAHQIIQDGFDWVNSIGLTGVLGIWGAFLSTGLVVIKLLELRGERLKLSVSCTLGHPHYGGNEVIIENPSKIPAMISHWKLKWRKRCWLKVRTVRTLDYGYPEDRRDFIIPAMNIHTLTFAEQDYFEWGYETHKRGKLYIELHMVGRTKPRLLEVYDPLRIEPRDKDFVAEPI